MGGWSGMAGLLLVGAGYAWLGAGEVVAWERPLVAESNIVLTAGLTTGGAVQLQIDYPRSFTSRLDIYASTNLECGVWRIQESGLSTAGHGSLTWTDPDAARAGRCFYRVGNADWDTDQDGVADARETWLHGTDPLTPDTDQDGVPDGAELRRGTDPVAGGSSVITLYVDSEAGSDSFDGLTPAVSGVHGPKRSLHSALEVSYVRDVIQLAGVAAFHEPSLCIGTRDVSLRPLGAIVIRP